MNLIPGDTIEYDVHDEDGNRVGVDFATVVLYLDDAGIMFARSRDGRDLVLFDEEFSPWVDSAAYPAAA